VTHYCLVRQRIRNLRTGCGRSARQRHYNPAAPKTGTTLVPRFRFEPSFSRDMIVSGVRPSARRSPPKSPPNRLLEFRVPEGALSAVKQNMDADAVRFALNTQHSRRAKVPPLLAAGLRPAPFGPSTHPGVTIFLLRRKFLALD
jgi:hypothetical protein